MAGSAGCPWHDVLRGKIRWFIDHPRFANAAQLVASLPLWVLAERRAWYRVEDFPTTSAVAERGDEIVREINLLLRIAEPVPVQAIDDAQRSFNRDLGWSVTVLRMYGRNVYPAWDDLPVLSSLVAACPDLVSLAVSVIEPGKRIPWHPGMYRGLVRFHVGIVIPADADDCWMQVGRERRSWRTGHVLVFDDAYLHRVHNNTAERRIVLMGEVVRPFRWAAVQRLNDRMIAWLSTRKRVDDIAARSRAFAEAEHSKLLQVE